MKKSTVLIIVSVLILLAAQKATACTNFLITKGASTDNSCMISYACDSHDIYGALYFWPSMDYAQGAEVNIIDWITGKFMGKIPQVRHTYRVVGNMNEHQLSISESTWGGRSELVDSTAIIDVGSLIYLTLQRAANAREAIQVMHHLVSTYGYASSGESFSIADPDEVWILELIGKDHGKKGAVWVARKIPDGYISAHANQARITDFPSENMKTSISSKYIDNNRYIFDPDLECVYAKDVISFAKEMGYIENLVAPEQFSFAETYNPITFGGARFCEARVYAGFNRVCNGMGKYLDYAMGENLDNRMPLWVKPSQKLSVRDVMELMRDYYQDTPMDMTKDPGAGPFGSTVRWRPLFWEVDGKTYFNERAASTQQTAFSVVAQSRSWLPDPIGGILWFGVDDTFMTVYTPLYVGLQKAPKCFELGNGDILNYSETSAFWLFNRVSNFAYHLMNRVMPEIKELQSNLENNFIDKVANIDQQAAILYKTDPERAIATVSDFSMQSAQHTFDSWKKLSNTLLVKYSDGNIKHPAQGEQNYVRRLFDTTFLVPGIEQPGYSEEFYRQIINATGNKFEAK